MGIERTPHARGSRSWNGQCQEVAAGGDGDVLSSPRLVTDGRRVDWRSGLKIPQRLAAGGIQREKVALVGSSECHPPTVDSTPDQDGECSANS
jgi:hypothetical protein